MYTITCTYVSICICKHYYHIHYTMYHYTAYIGLVWTLYFLSLNPHIVRDLREREVDRIMHDVHTNTISKEDALDTLSFTAICFKEAMRLRGPASHISVELADKSSTYTLKSGRIVYPTDLLFCSFDTLKRDSSVFDRPEVYDPYRWLTSDADKLTKMDSYIMTFGHGPRICPGTYFLL